MFRISLLASALLISACSPNIQTTSGAAYLAASPIDDPAIVNAAAIEPDLRFPARIGVVQMVQGRIWDVSDGLLPEVPVASIGEIVPLSPLTFGLTGTHHSRYRNPQIDNFREIAASRHVDYLLVVALNPARNTAEAVLVDVRTGYPYASASADVPGNGRRNFWGNPSRNQAVLDREGDRLAEALAPDLAEMFTLLRAEAG